jgi:cytochrome c-type biogenesis protein CcmH
MARTRVMTGPEPMTGPQARRGHRHHAATGTMRPQASMRRWALALTVTTTLIALFATAAYAVDPTQMPTPELQKRYLGLTHELRCMQCQNEAIADSPVDLAADLRRQVHDMLLAGKTDDDVRDFMVARYGEFILFRPRMSVRTAWLWLAPGVLILIGAFVAVRIVQQRSALVTQDNEPLEEDIRA